MDSRLAVLQLCDHAVILLILPFVVVNLKYLVIAFGHSLPQPSHLVARIDIVILLGLRSGLSSRDMRIEHLLLP